MQGAVLVFVYDMFSFAGPVLLQQLLQSLEDRSTVGELDPRCQDGLQMLHVLNRNLFSFDTCRKARVVLTASTHRQ